MDCSITPTLTFNYYTIMTQKLGSHNSWSYLPPKKWWMKLIKFTAQCQNVDIMTQYDTWGVQLFDLRIRFDTTKDSPLAGLKLVNGIVEYNFTYTKLIEELSYLDSKKDAAIRLILDLRGVDKKDYTLQRTYFNRFYRQVLKNFKNIKYLVGRDLPTWKKCIITLSDGSIRENYASVSNPKWFDDWYPKLYAKNKNKYNKRNFFNNVNTKEEYLLIDFINI